MPWKDRTVMDERIRFVARLLEGESMALLCREFNISRKTGYKIFDRYKECGLEGISDRTRRPHRYGNQLPVQVETAILTLKQDKPHWGARKIREKLLRRFASEVKVPAQSTIHAVLDRHGLVKRMRHRRGRAEGTALSLGQQPNELWCTDYKGEFLLGNQKYCYPLTVTDHASRYLLLCEALESTRETWRLRPLSVCSRNAVCPHRFVPIMAYPSPRVIRCLISAAFRSGGFVWASASKGSGLVIRSRTDDTNGCI